jgi:hypothetical protein
MRVALIALSFTSALMLGSAPANAQYWQGNGTWCIQPPVGGGIWQCSFYSYEQCEATRQGVYHGGCVPNPEAEWDRREGKNKGKGKKAAPPTSW